MSFEVKIDMAKFDAIEAGIKEKCEMILSGTELKREVGEFAVERIKYQVRVGVPWNMNGSFPDLKDSTIKNRRYLAQYNKTHATYAEQRANLTLTGELMDSLTWVDEGNTLLKLQFEGTHKPYNSKHGPMKGKPVDNAKLAEWLAAKGFKVFDSSLANNKQFVSRIKTICLRYIRRGLRISNRLDASEG